MKRTNIMTIEDLERMTCPTITADIAAKVIDCEAQSIRDQAQHDPKMLGFPVCVMGRRVRIPRMLFINYLRGVSYSDIDDQTLERISNAIAQKLIEGYVSINVNIQPK